LIKVFLSKKRRYRVLKDAANGQDCLQVMLFKM